ncbi:MAG: family 2A encapsulin nanocompartment cargo protein cysteine desulfurase [Acidobacteriaceae bacterium]|nr:family 2A encapsulin nanocompartment cargo protein cysteine desulfurase [Acidobacteriaceae bacterium]
MSTNDPRLQLDETAVAQAKSAVGAALPDVAVLTQMANSFFRALPGQDVAGQSVPASPGLPSSFATALPLSDSHLPQFGAPAPSVPSLPSIDKLSSEADFARLPDSAVPVDFPVGITAFSATPSLAPYTSSIPTPNSVPLQSTAVPSSPQSVAVAPVSPFSLPLPDFDLPFPNFESSLPNIPELPALGTDDFAKSSFSAFSPLYFLEHAGALSQPIASAPQPAQGFEPQALPELNSIRRQFDVTSIRRDFPILQEKVNGKPLIWLDNAATTQKPQAVIDRLKYFYEHENSNIHRAAHELAARATDAYEDARSKVAHFLNAPSSKEIVFVRGATEAINLVAQSWGRQHIGKGDEIVISWIEHHANIVPWQMLAAEKGAILRVIPVDNDGQILLDEYEKLLNTRTKLVSFTHVSNALGTITPAQQMVQMAHRYGARVLVDGAQAVSHMRVDVQRLDADFYVFSGHKVFGPTGIGVLYGKPDALADSPPWQGGGNMIADVTFEKTIYQPPPFRFEAGTGNIADAVGLGAAIAYLDTIGMENIARHEHELLVYATQELLRIPGLCIIGTAKEKAGVLSFVLEGYKPEDVGAALNREGIAVRSGHHCAQPTLRRFGQETTVRPSLALYNNYEDIDAMIAALRRLKNLPA